MGTRFRGKAIEIGVTHKRARHREGTLDSKGTREKRRARARKTSRQNS